jgi:hypothetical protein
VTWKERFQLRLAVLGASASLLAGVVPSCIQLVDDAGQDSHASVSCSAAIERVVEIEEDHPRVADLYAHEADYLPSLFSPEEKDACGDPAHLVEELGRDLDG